MITGELKNKIDSLWEIFWTGGLTNPLDVIEQMTYLMFIHDLDDADNLHMKESAMLGLPYQSIFADEVTVGERSIAGNQLKWSVFHDFPAQKMYDVMQEWVFPFIKNLHGDKESAYAKYMGDAIFKIPTPLMLDKIVTAMDEIYAGHLRIFAVEAVNGRSKWTVPDAPPYYQNDGRIDGPEGRRSNLRSRLRNLRLPCGCQRISERTQERRSLF